MELRDIEAFVAVAEELHFGRAAARLHISQPPLSNRIRQLEADLKVSLFTRSTRSVTLTDAGQRLLGPARQVLTQLSLTRAVAEAIVAGETGRVRVGFAGASTQRSLPILSRAIRELHPGIELQLQSQAYVFTAMEMLRDGSLDLAFARLPSPDPDLDFRVIEVEEIVCALPTGHRLARRESVRLTDLRNEGFISLPDDQGSILQATMSALCVTAGFTPRVTQYAPDSATALALVAAGVGVTITLSTVQPVQPMEVVYLPLEDISPSHMFATLAWRRADPSPALRTVLKASEGSLPTPDLSRFANNPFLIGIGQE
ncbi:LysR substrate-binding domain-containing protein [Microbacterium sp. SSM24]|uniref:LysR substrate-binding domain-containing protein n=1 Tax=Microbacterium sp. SSM24 TaxID=2991714 RepID=UPI002226E82B|nr:LysR substrate-binding domain-containing protein [Microbacterium sp. SSM24]MCW3492659.1 LysR substrate-binding domain-containing protein [Microbacterium sp. SSM24]